MRKNRSLLLITHYSLLITLIFSSGCGPRRTPNLERIFDEARTREGKRPIIVIPGILGSQLVNHNTGEVVWPSAFRSSEDGLSLPTTPDLEANRDNLDAVKILSTAKFGRIGTRTFGPEVYVYYELLNALEKYVGYREGNWDAPAADGDRDTFYVFAYDWRRDNVESARLLVRRIEELKLKLGRPDLRFNILAHSMGGLVARYAAMYGDTDLPARGLAPRPTWAGASGINNIFMIGTPNEGSAEAFSTLLEGYSVTEGLRRRVRLLNKLSREDALTAPSIFQLLPHRHTARFLDEHLQPLAVDLYDPATWKLYGWSVISRPGYRARFVEGKTDTEDPPRKGSTLEELDAYFAAVLERARRFHDALDASGGANASPVTLFAFGGDCEETLAAPVLLRDAKSGDWLTLTRPRSLRTPDGRRISTKDVTRAMYGPGDGRVTRQSLLGAELGPERRSLLFNSALPIAYATFVCDLHSELQKNKTLQDNSLTLLVSELMK